jgi:hypothetical protein
MKKIILLTALSLVFIFTSCSKDPLGIEDNVKITKLTKDDSIPEVKTKFRSDTVVCEFVEKIKLVSYNDTISVKWNPLLIDASAIIDTLGGLKLDAFSLSVQRAPDSLAEYRKEQVLGFYLNLDSFNIVDRTEFGHTNEYYKSKIAMQFFPSKKVENKLGNYPLLLTFRAPVYDNKKMILRGRFQITIPLNQTPKKYDYLYIGEFAIHFTLE